MTEPTKPGLFDATAAWENLTPEQKHEIGVAAIIAGLGGLGEADMLFPEQAYGAARTSGFEAIEDAVFHYVLKGREIGQLARPDLSPLGVKVCRECGCTDACGCPDGCSWVEDDLCSACVEVTASSERAYTEGLSSVLVAESSFDHPKVHQAFLEGKAERLRKLRAGGWQVESGDLDVLGDPIALAKLEADLAAPLGATEGGIR